MILVCVDNVSGKPTLAYERQGTAAQNLAEQEAPTSAALLRKLDIELAVGPTTLALLVQNTSGTDRSQPPLVSFTHEEILVAVQNSARSIELTDLDNNLLTSPLCEVHSLVGQLLAPSACVATVVLPERDCFNAASFWRDAFRNRITWYTA